MKETRIARKIIGTLTKDRIHYPHRVIIDTATIIARCGVLLVLYWYVFNLNGGAVSGISYAVAAWSMFFYFALSTLRLRDIARKIMQDVQSGSVEILFNKPISYLGYRIWWQIGSGLYPFLVATILGVLTLIFIIGLPKAMLIWIFLPSALLTFIGAVILSLILYSIVGFVAFWLEDINPLYWLIDKAVMILGGSYLPVALFPKFMYNLALYSPFGASQFVTHTVYDSWQTNWFLLIGIQVFWIVALGLILYLFFGAAQKKISVNGG